MSERKPPITSPANIGIVIRHVPAVTYDATKTEQEAPNKVAEQLKEKKQPRLSDLNPLLYPPELHNAEAVSAFEQAIRDKIEQYRGVQPTTVESAIAFNPENGTAARRLIIKFELEQLTEEQITRLEQIAQETYGPQTRGRKTSSGYKIAPSFYPNLEATKRGGHSRRKTSRLLGWYMGLNPADLTNFHMGLLTFKDLGEADIGDYFKRKNPNEWFFKDNLVNPHGKPLKTKYLVEIREADLYQTDIVQLAVKVATVLANTDEPSNELLYEIYNDLNRINLKKATRESIHGLDEQINRIRRVLIIPLANLRLSSGLELPPGSVLLTGVPGTGKTLIAEYLLQEDTGVFLLPLDPKQLSSELRENPANRPILNRITSVFNKTEIPIIFLLEDLETISSSESEINSTLLNLMAGVRENGFYGLGSTNHPEQFSMQLLQPQRFAHVIYLGLHDEEARAGIIDIHATQTSKELNVPLFASEEERRTIIAALAKNTEDFTPRFLAEICTEAKTYYLERIAKQRKAKGMTEADIGDERFTLDDWANGFAQTKAKYDKKSVTDRDKQIQEFVRHHINHVGFIHTDSANGNDFLASVEELRRTE